MHGKMLLHDSLAMEKSFKDACLPQQETYPNLWQGKSKETIQKEVTMHEKLEAQIKLEVPQLLSLQSLRSKREHDIFLGPPWMMNMM